MMIPRALLAVACLAAVASAAPRKSASQQRKESLEVAKKQCVYEIMNLAMNVGNVRYIPNKPENSAKMKAYAEDAARILNKHKPFQKEAGLVCGELMSSAAKIAER